MNESDKVLARRALEKKRLTIGQVEQLLAEAGRSGRSFRDVALGRGLLSAQDFEAAPPPKPMPTPYLLLLFASLMIFMGLLLATTWHLQERSKRDVELAVGQSRNMTEADRLSSEARRGYERSIIAEREAKARQALAKARTAMAKVATAPSIATPEATQALNEAFVGYNAYLDVLPDDADVRLERAKTHEMRRNYDLAIADLERAAQLKPDQAKPLNDRIAQLRLLLARNPR